MAVCENPAMQIQMLRSMHVPNERDLEFRKQLYRLFQVDADGNTTHEPCRYTGGTETRGIAVIEAAGGGKTTAIRKVLHEAEFLAFNPITGMPRYLEIHVPSPATNKSVGLAILEATGMEGVTERSKVWEIWKTVQNRLKLLGIKVLWLDEAHDLVMARSAIESETTLRLLKTLMQGENAIIPILSGTRQLAEMTNFDPQVSRRFTKIVPLDLQQGVDNDNLAGLIEAYCSEVDIQPRLPADLTARLMVASRYRFGRAVETIINAIECALWAEARTLGRVHFSEAWAMQEGCEPDANVFEAGDWLSIPLDKGAEEFEAARAKRQKKKLERV